MYMHKLMDNRGIGAREVLIGLESAIKSVFDCALWSVHVLGGDGIGAGATI